MRGLSLPAGRRDDAERAGGRARSPGGRLALRRTPRRTRAPLVGTVIATTFLGATSRITVDLGDTRSWPSSIPSEAAALPAGSRVSLRIREDPVLVALGGAPAAAEEQVAPTGA